MSKPTTCVEATNESNRRVPPFKEKETRLSKQSTTEEWEVNNAIINKDARRMLPERVSELRGKKTGFEK